MTAGYSGTPLLEKLGIKPRDTIIFVNEPSYYPDLLGSLPEDISKVNMSSADSADFIHLFAENKQALYSYFPSCKEKLDKKGILWVSWIKKSSSMETDIAEQDVRKLGLNLGLVDVKICAVDADWSGLKFVYRKEDR